MVQVPLIVDARAASTTTSIATARARPCASTSRTTTSSTRSTPRSCRRRRSGSGWRSGSSACEPGEGLLTDMRAVRKDYFLDHDHSAYVDQWDWEKAITAGGPHARLPHGDRPLDLEGAEGGRARPPRAVPGARPIRATRRSPTSSSSSTPRTSSTRIPTCRASSARRRFLQDHPAVFIYGIGWPLADGLSARAARRRLRRLVDRDGLRGRAADARPERRHPRLEPGHAPPARADVGRHPRDEGVARAASSSSPGSSTSSSCRTTRRSCATRSRSRSAPGSASRAR